MMDGFATKEDLEEIKNQNLSTLELCDIWLNYIYDAYNVFNTYVLSKRKKQDNKLRTVMEVNINENNNDENNIDNTSDRTFSIKLNLYYRYDIIVDGINLEISEKNYPIFEYLLLNLFIFYLKNNFKTPIGFYDSKTELLNDKDDKLIDFYNSKFCSFFEIRKNIGVYSSYLEFCDIYNKDKELHKKLTKMIIRHNTGIDNIDDLLEPVRKQVLKCNKNELYKDDISNYTVEKVNILKRITNDLKSTK